MEYDRFCPQRIILLAVIEKKYILHCVTQLNYLLLMKVTELIIIFALRPKVMECQSTHVTLFESLLSLNDWRPSQLWFFPLPLALTIPIFQNHFQLLCITLRCYLCSSQKEGKYFLRANVNSADYGLVKSGWNRQDMKEWQSMNKMCAYLSCIRTFV